MTSQLKHCKDEQNLEEFLLSGHPVENDSTQPRTYVKSLETTKHNLRKRIRSITPELAQNINKMTLNDKLQSSDSTTQNTKLSAISAQDSTENAKVLLPFWNEYTQEESKKLWLPKRLEFSSFYLFSLSCIYYFTNLFYYIRKFFSAKTCVNLRFYKFLKYYGNKLS